MEKKTNVASDLVKKIRENNEKFRDSFGLLVEDIEDCISDAIADADPGAFWGYRYIGFPISEICFAGEETYPEAKMDFTKPTLMMESPSSRFNPYHEATDYMGPDRPMLKNLSKIQADCLVEILESAGFSCFFDTRKQHLLIFLEIEE